MYPTSISGPNFEYGYSYHLVLKNGYFFCHFFNNIYMGKKEDTHDSTDELYCGVVLVIN